MLSCVKLCNSCELQASRLELAERFQIPQRDLRLLDPWVPVPIPVSFLVRKHAILANLGAVRVLISRCEVRRPAMADPNTDSHHLCHAPASKTSPRPEDRQI